MIRTVPFLPKILLIFTCDRKKNQCNFQLEIPSFLVKIRFASENFATSECSLLFCVEKDEYAPYFGLEGLKCKLTKSVFWRDIGYEMKKNQKLKEREERREKEM